MLHLPIRRELGRPPRLASIAWFGSTAAIRRFEQQQRLAKLVIFLCNGINNSVHSQDAEKSPAPWPGHWRALGSSAGKCSECSACRSANFQVPVQVPSVQQLGRACLQTDVHMAPAFQVPRPGDGWWRLVAAGRGMGAVEGPCRL